MPAVNRVASTQLCRTLESMNDVGLRGNGSEYILKLLKNIIRFLTTHPVLQKFINSNDHPFLNTLSEGLYNNLKKGRITVIPNEAVNNSMADNEGFYNYKLVIHGHQNDIKLRIDHNNNIHLKHDDRTMNLNTGQEVNAEDHIVIRHDLSPDFISMHFSMLLRNALSVAYGNPPDYNFQSYAEVDDAGLLTSTMRPLPEGIDNNTCVLFEYNKSVLSGCQDTQDTDYIKNAAFNCHYHQGLGADLARMNCDSSTFITFNGQNILGSSIFTAIKKYGRDAFQTDMSKDEKVVDLYRYIGDEIKEEYGDNIFGGLTSEQGMYLIAMANSQGVQTQGLWLSGRHLNDHQNNFKPAGLVNTLGKIMLPGFKGRSLKYISVETSETADPALLKASLKINEYATRGQNERSALIKYEKEPGYSPVYEPEAQTRWAVCNDITLHTNSALLDIEPDNLSYGYSLNLKECSD